MVRSHIKRIQRLLLPMCSLGSTPQGLPPKFITTIQPEETKEGATVRFECNVKGEPSPDIEWYKDNQYVEQSDRVKIDTKDGVSVLTIENVSTLDEAVYKVLARNPVGTSTCTAELLVEEPVSKPVLVKRMKDVNVKQGEVGSFSVRVKGDVKVDWYRNGKLLKDAGNVVIVDEDDGETFTLAVEEAKIEDSGVYKCVATNKAGEVTCKATLKVTPPEDEIPSPEDAALDETLPAVPIDDIVDEMIGKSLGLEGRF